MTTPETEKDTSVTNDKDAGKDTSTGRLDGSQIDKVPFVGQGVSAYKSGEKLVEDPAANWSEAVNIGTQVYGMANNVMSIAADPLNWLISQGLGFLIDWIQPLQDAIGYVTGNPERMDEEIAKWTRVQNALTPLAQEVRDASNNGLLVWEGKASDAAKTRLNDFADGVDGIANDVKLIQMIMNISKMLMELAYNFVLGLIAEFVEWMIMIWIPALASAPVTFGGSTAAAGTATAYRATATTSRVTKFIQKVNMILTRLKMLLRKVSASGMNKAGTKFRNRDGGRFAAGYKGPGQVIKDFATDRSAYFSPSNPNTWISRAPGAVQAGKQGVDWATDEHHYSDEELDKKLSGD
ncbi:hypothetical protein [Flindersiella endophytica]